VFLIDSMPLALRNKDEINFVKCSKRIMKNYSELVKLSNNDNKLQEVVKSIKSFLQGDKKNYSYIDILEETSNQPLHLSDREKASGYNFLGNTLLELIKQDVNVNILCNIFKTKSFDSSYDCLSIIKRLFEKANYLSAGTKDYTEANAQDGLAKIELFETQSKQKQDSAFSKDSYQAIESIIDHLKERNKINDLLTKKEAYKDTEICSALNQLLVDYNLDSEQMKDCTNIIGSVCPESAMD